MKVFTKIHTVTIVSILFFHVLFFHNLYSLADTDKMPMRSMNLQQLLEYAFENSSQMKTNSILIKNSELEIENIQANFFPSLDLSMSNGLKDNLSDDRPNKNLWSSSFSLNLSETFYDNGVNWTNYKIGKLKKQKSDIIFLKEREKLAMDLSKAYLQHSYLSKMLELEMEQLELLKKQNDIIAKFYYQGLKTKRDYLRFKTEVNRAEIALASAKNSLTISSLEIYKILSISYDENNRPTENIKIILDDRAIIPGNLNNITSNLLNTSHLLKITDVLDYKMGKFDEEISSLEVDLVDKKVGPEFSLISGVNYSVSNYISGEYSWDESDSVNWEILLTIKYNIWDWGSRRRNKEIAINRKRIERIEFEEKITNIRSESSKILLAVKEKIENSKNSEELLKLEEDNYQLIHADYRNGKVAYLDLITALKSKAEAKMKYYSAYYNLKQTIFDLHYQQGLLYDFIIKKN